MHSYSGESAYSGVGGAGYRNKYQYPACIDHRWVIILHGYDQQKDQGIFWQLAATPIEVVIFMSVSTPKIGQMKMTSSLPKATTTACADQLRETSSKSAESLLSNFISVVFSSPYSVYRLFGLRPDGWIAIPHKNKSVCISNSGLFEPIMGHLRPMGGLGRHSLVRGVSDAFSGAG